MVKGNGNQVQETFTLVIFTKTRNTASVDLSGKTAAYTRASLFKTKSN
jgi:hypothetical protein